MNYIKFLYYKYYKFQVKVGNADVAPYSSVLIIASIFMLYYFSLFFFLILFIPHGVINTEAFKYISISLLFVLMALLSLLLLRKRKYIKILEMEEAKYSGKKYLSHILLPLFAFLLLNIGMALKVLQNQGKL